MNPEAILFPSIAMFFLSAAMLLRLGALRFQASKKREVRPSYYALYRDNQAEPDYLRVMSRHAQNHFEIPPLFHLGVLMTYVTGKVSAFAVGLAWAFVLLRAAHSFVHLGSNNVNQRFFVFALSSTLVIALWARMLIVLL